MSRRQWHTIFLIYFKLLFVSCAKNSSLTFVIDDTLSMLREIRQVRLAAEEIMNIVQTEKASEIENVVLVTFNDPDVVLRENTSDKDTLLKALSNITVHNSDNRDCPEYALTGIEKALEESKPSSYLFVFTDASAKDHYKVKRVISLCEKKQSQVVFVLTGDCGHSKLVDYKVYHEIGKACNGQVFKVLKNEVKDVLQTIKEFTKGKRTVVTSQVVPPSNHWTKVPILQTIKEFTKGKRNVVTSQVVPPSNHWTKVPFTVDDQSEYVIVSTSGKIINLWIKNSTLYQDTIMRVNKIMWKSSGKVVKFNAPKPGTYYAWVKGYTDISIIVYARTDYSFNYGFSSFVPKTLEDTSKQPIKGEGHHLSITVTDPNNALDIKYAEILNMQEKVITNLPLTKVKENYYITETFVSPYSTFKIQVTGINKNTANVIKRLARTNVDPQDPPKPDFKAPDVVITEGLKVDVPYAGEILLTCKVSAYPKPEIVWTSDNGAILGSDSNLVEKPYDYISYLKLPNVRKAEIYHCKASNNLARNVVAKIHVKPRNPLKAIELPAATSIANFGEQKKLVCNVESQYTLEIEWKVPAKSKHSDYSVSDDQKVLTIKAVSMDAQGMYTCETSLKSDREYKITAATTLKIDNLASPSILNTANQISRKFGDRAQIACKINGGVPPPIVTWQVMRTGEKAFKEISIRDEELNINSLTLEDSGKYRCIVRNTEGHIEKTIELSVTKTAEATIQEGQTRSFPYGSTNELTCKVTGNPLPSVVWKDSKGNKLIAQQNMSNNYEITSSVRITEVKNPDTYYCHAGKAVSKIYIKVTSPFVIVGHPPASINSKYGADTDITCNIQSKFPMEITWFYQSASIKTGRTKIHTSDTYTISSDQKTLRILSTDLKKTGTYTCAVSLNSDKDQTLDFTTKLQLDDLSPPELKDTAAKVTVNYKDAASLLCKIVRGTPPPTIGWQVKYKGENDFRNLPVFGQELTIASATLENSGHYRCTATNDIGNKTKDTELSVTKIPEAIIQEGQTRSFPYGSTNELTCKVTGNPLPSVVWKDSKGNKLIAQQNISNNYEITSSVRITNVKNSDTYYCHAGKAVSKIYIHVTSPFVVVGHPPAIINSKYGANTDITCNIQSKFPMEIAWLYQSASIKTQIHTSDTYTISLDGKTLRILSTDLKKTGSYSCGVSLNSDEDQRLLFTTKVQIDDLSPPELKDTAAKVTVNYKDAASLPCKIVGGTPPPTIGWQVKYKGENDFQNLPGSGQELTIASSTLENSGQYRCTATNDIGNKTKDTELVVQKVPETTIDKGSSITVPYGSTNELKCRVIAYPQPIIVWKNSKGHKLLAKDITNQYETVSILNLTNARSSETYVCSAENNKGTADSSIDVKVSRAIAFPTQSKETTSVKFGTPAVIKCEASSSFPMKIKWFHQKNDRSSDMIEIHTSDKYTISSDEKMLQIMSTNLNLAGTYTCVASLVFDENEKLTYTNVVIINDLTAPEILVDKKTITVMKGQSVSSSCRVYGVPKPTVIWQFKAKSSDTYVPFTMQGVQIINTGYDSAGTYMCIATNAVGTQSETIDLIVHGKPEITNADSVYYGVRGDQVLQVPCEVTGVPEPAVVWKQGGKVVTSDGKITVNKNSLYVKEPAAKDSCNFTCEATNMYGKATKNVQVDISDFIEPEKVKSRNIYLKQGGSTEDMICDLPNPGPWSIRWYVNSELSAVKSLTYSLQNANFSNDGNYTCRVNTDQGSESLNYVVDVGFLPSFVKPSTSPVYWIGYKKDILDCNVDAKPEGNIVWHFNGNEVHNKVPELFIMGWGRYTCNVTNVHGSVQRSFDVTSLGCIINRTVDNNSKNTPLLVNDKDATWPELLKENEFYILNKNQTLDIQCGTKRNTINTFKIKPTNNKITAECYKEDQFIVDGKKYKFDDLQCKEYVKPSFEYTKTPCMKNGEIIEVGFALDSGFLSAYDVCYEQTNHKTLYTKVFMSDQNLGNKVDSGFKVDTELSNVGQIVKCQYNKRRLVNPVDVAFGPAQAATLSEYNSVPVFEPCDGSNRKSWSAVEEVVNLALENDIESFTLWTGASQYDTAGVPRYLWKVAMFGGYVDTLVFVNAPDVNISDIRCSKHDNEILVAQFSDDDNDPYMYACSKDDFLKGFDLSVDEFKET